MKTTNAADSTNRIENKVISGVELHYITPVIPGDLAMMQFVPAEFRHGNADKFFYQRAWVMMNARR